MKVQCKNCGKEFELTHIKCQRQTDDPNCVDYDGYAVCPHCETEFMLDEDANVELTGEQSDRLDIIYDAALEFCRVLTEDPELEHDMSYIGEVTDAAVDILVEQLRRPIRYPAIVSTEEKDGVYEEYNEDTVEPVTKENAVKVITSAAGHRIHK